MSLVSPTAEDRAMADEPAPPAERKGAITVRGATFLGIGSMIGAGIFALLGEAGAVAGAAVWISFLIGGVVAALLGYVCVKLGTRYPSSGGLITYLVEGFGRGRLVGIASWLGYIAAIVLGFFAVDTWRNARQTFAAIVAILVLAVILDFWTRAGRRRQGAPEWKGRADAQQR
jgi:amino acid transporter